eukprot:gnl/MRDRNA2_/MRDRNA2_207566_c0_seq1.p1 gnl/MRDRNA2_/MRDRNA2_207566_c0~~gnl/MRDRNA2_/MRDRNA2_207566_c0_seq1.p1  ORF type:complete len:290 (+),score=57.43 gnl/MRDRNA2_/MRDRNA2_207566_c0_seq1:90-959(+)
MGQGQNIQRCLTGRECTKQCMAFPKLPHFSSDFSGASDKERFERAFENNDLEALVALLQSPEPIVVSEERIHPWAQDPQSVGALAATQFAILAAAADRSKKGNTQTRGLKDRIRVVGAIPPLVDFLRSAQPDRVHAAVVALSFLAADNRENCMAMHKAGAMQLLLPLLSSGVEGMRAASASILRCIVVESADHLQEFVDLGGIQMFVELLGTCPSSQLDAVLNLQDLLEGVQTNAHAPGKIVPEYAEIAIRSGVENKLKGMHESDDEDVRFLSLQLLQSILQSVGKSGK